ncbi:hypothetical protein Tco_1171285 [Tanacetum coccineum]
MMDIKVQHEDPSIQTSPLLTVPVTVILESLTAPTTTIPLLIPPFIPLLQQSTPIPTPTTTEATISTTSAPDSSTLTAFHQRFSDLENEVKILRNVDHSSAIRAASKSEVATIVKEYLGTNLDDTLHKMPWIKVLLTFKKRKPDDADRDEDPLAGPDQGLKKRKTGKDTEQSKRSKLTGTSKGTTKSQPNSIGKSAQAKETAFLAGDTQVPQDLREDMGNTNELPVFKADPKDWFKKPERPPTPDPEWNEGKTVDNKPTQKWLNDLAKEERSSKTFDDLKSIPIDFSVFIMNRLLISDLTHYIMIGSAYKILKGMCRSYVELEYNMEEYYKALTDQLDWNNPKDLPGTQDMVPNLWSPIKVAYEKHALLVNVWYVYGHLEEIEFQRSDQKLYKFIEGDIPQLHQNDIEDMLLLVVQNKLFNLKGEDIVHLAAALCIFTIRTVIQKRVEDLQLGADSYQKKLNISKLRTHEEDLS